MRSYYGLSCTGSKESAESEEPMKLFCPLMNTITDVLLVLFFVLQLKTVRKKARYTAMLSVCLGIGLVIGALFGLCTRASEIILMSALMNTGILLCFAMVGLIGQRRQHSVLFVILAILLLASLVLYLKA